MMPREVYNKETAKNLEKDYQDPNSNNNEIQSMGGVNKSKNDGKYCYPLCEKKFKNGDILRYIQPCNHVFHE